MIALAEFAGRWQVTRRIRDHAGGVEGRFSGQADFRPDGAGLIYSEAGCLRYGKGPVMQAERRYLWRADGTGIAVFFDDGRPFHRFSATSLTAHHDCPPDSYDVRYDFADWPDWRCFWQVSGPRKSYEMESEYGRGLGSVK